jgi:hypothetical protein
MKSKKSANTTVVLANANELVAGIMRGVVGNDVADSINGSPLTRESIFNLVQAEIQNAEANGTLGV